MKQQIMIFIAIFLVCFRFQSAASNKVLTFENARIQADAGDAFAQAVVATHYQLGWMAEKNPEAAAQYALASAKAGNPLGMFRLGALIRAGEGVEKDEQKGLQWQAAAFERLTHNGEAINSDPYSYTAVGIMKFQGKVVDRDVASAAQIYKISANEGYAPAQFNYAMCAAAGHGTEKSNLEKTVYLILAADNGYPPAIQELAKEERTTARHVTSLPILRDAKANFTLEKDITTVIQKSPDPENAPYCTINRKRTLFCTVGEGIGLWELPSGRFIKEHDRPPVLGDASIGGAFFRGEDILFIAYDKTGMQHTSLRIIFIDPYTGEETSPAINLRSKVARRDADSWDYSPIGYCEKTDRLLLYDSENDLFEVEAIS